MSDSSSITGDANRDKCGEVDIHDNIDSFVLYMENLKKSLQYIREQFQILRDGYLDALKTEKPGTSQREIEHVNRQYEIVNKQLYRFIKVFVQDYADALDKSIEITKLREEYNLLVRQNCAGIFESDDMYQLERKFNRLVKRHNRIASQYNEEAQRFDLLQNSLKKKIIFYAPTEERSFEINLDRELNRFKHLVEFDVIGQKLTKIYQDFRVFVTDNLKKSANTKKLITVTPLSSFGDSLEPSVRQKPKFQQQVPTASNPITIATNRKRDREEDPVSSSNSEQQNDFDNSGLKSYQKIRESWKLKEKTSSKLKHSLNDQIMHPHVQLYLLVWENGTIGALNTEKSQLAVKKFEFNTILDYILDNDFTELDKAFQTYLTAQKSPLEDEPENEGLKPIFFVLHILSDECRTTIEVIDILFNLSLKLNEKQKIASPKKHQSNIDMLLQKIDSKLKKPLFSKLTGILQDEDKESYSLWQETQLMSTYLLDDEKFKEFLKKYWYLLEIDGKEIEKAIEYGKEEQQELYGDKQTNLDNILKADFLNDKKKISSQLDYLEEQLKLTPVQYYYLHFARNTFTKVKEEGLQPSKEEIFELAKKVRVNTLAIQRTTLTYEMIWEKILKLGGKPVNHRDHLKERQTRNSIIHRGTKTLLIDTFLEISEILCEISNMRLQKINSEDKVKENELSISINRKETEWHELMKMLGEHSKIYKQHPEKIK